MHLPQSFILSKSISGPTWFLAGACLQFLLVLTLPRHVALLTAALLFATLTIASSLKTTAPAPTTPYQNDVLQGRYTARFPPEYNNSEVVVFLLGASVNSSRGTSDEDFKVLTGYFHNMWKEAELAREKWGYLGKSSVLHGTAPSTQNTLITLSYWTSVSSLRAFAASPAHQEGWTWWNRTVKEHPHLGIMHEVYAAPRGQWENIYVNFRPFGMGQIQAVDPGDENGGLKSVLVPAKGARSRSMLGRMMNQMEMGEGEGDGDGYDEECS